MTPSVTFRKEAEARIDSFERSTAGLRVVDPGVVVLAAALLALLLGAMAMGFVVHVPIMVHGTGVIISSKGVLQTSVAAGYEGRISHLLVDVGDRVVPGQEIARIVQPGLQNELRLAISEREQIFAETAQIRGLQAEAMALSDRLRLEQERNARDAIMLLEQRLRILEQFSAAQESLRRDGNLTVDRQLQVAAQLAEARERLSSRRSELLSNVIARNEREAQFQRELQALEVRRAQAERQVERLEARIRSETVVLSTDHGIVGEIKVVPGDLVRYETSLVSLLPVDESFADTHPGANRLIAAVLVPAHDGKRVRPAMRALIDPRSVRRDVYGAIEGVVIRTSDVPSSADELRLMLRNEELVRSLTANGPPFLVRIEMSRDARTPTGYRWTTSSGPPGEITAGTLLEAEIETEHVALVSLLLPALRQWLRGEAGRSERRF